MVTSTRPHYNPDLRGKPIAKKDNIDKKDKLECIQNLQINLSQIFSSIYNKWEFEKAKVFLISNLENIFTYYTIQINYPSIKLDFKIDTKIIDFFENYFALLKNDIVLICTHRSRSSLFFNYNLTESALDALEILEKQLREISFEPEREFSLGIKDNETTSSFPLNISKTSSQLEGNMIKLQGMKTSLAKTVNLSQEYAKEASEIRATEENISSGCCTIS
jgi:hypothetical protein